MSLQIAFAALAKVDKVCKKTGRQSHRVGALFCSSDNGEFVVRIRRRHAKSASPANTSANHAKLNRKNNGIANASMADAWIAAGGA